MATRRSFLSTALLLGGGAAAAWYMRDRVFWPVAAVGVSATGGDSGWLPFASERLSLPTVAATVNGEPVTALVDSGAQTSVIDRALAEQMQLPLVIGPPAVAYGVGGGVQAARGADLEVGLGDLSLSRVRAVVLTLGPLSGPLGGEASLVLGQDVLNAVIVEIDFPGRRVRFVEPERHEARPETVAAPVRRVGRALMATVEVEGVSLEVVVDTGASAALSLSARTAEAAGLLDGRPTRTATSLVLGGTSTGQVVTAASLRFAGETREDVPVHIFPDQALPGFPEGLLGVGAMDRGRVVLDHAGGRLKLAPA